MSKRRSVSADLRRSRQHVLRWSNQATVDLAEQMHLEGKHDQSENWAKTCPICRTFVIRAARE